MDRMELASEAEGCGGGVRKRGVTEGCSRAWALGPKQLPRGPLMGLQDRGAAEAQLGLLQSGAQWLEQLGSQTTSYLCGTGQAVHGGRFLLSGSQALRPCRGL